VPRRNRVTPVGDIIATPERGLFMGNRGVLHDAHGHVRRAWQVKRWIVCVLAFRGRKRRVMAPGHYTELFFLDEATALAAGHRPCAECRRERFNAFREAWRSAHAGSDGSGLPTADEIDRRLHAERVGPDRSKRSFSAKLDELPNGVFVRHANSEGEAFLVCNDGLLVWTAAGYPRRIDRTKNGEMLVLTPQSTVRAIRAGYVPQVHRSALALT
jgi:hypothetical protein